MEKSRIQLLFGTRCKELRHADGASQESFALRIGMDRTYYASIESGRRNVTLQSMEKIAMGFGITLSELLAGV